MDEFALQKTGRAGLAQATHLGLLAKQGLTRALLAMQAGPARFDGLLMRAAHMNVPGGFCVPTPFARRALGERLQITLPAGALKTNFYPWVCAFGPTFRALHYFVGDGDWSSVLFPFGESSVYREMGDLIAHETDYRRCRTYRAFDQHRINGTPMMRNGIYLNTEALIDAYFARYLALLRSVRERGIVRISQETAAARCDGFIDIGETDIGIGIYKDGSVFCLPEARHRAAIAVHLNLPAIPVEIRLIHRDWLREVLGRGFERGSATRLVGQALATVQTSLNGAGAP